MTLQEAIEAMENGEDVVLADLCANLPPLPEGIKAQGLSFDENGKMIEDFSYLEPFES
jgi:hypothetical protein